MAEASEPYDLFAAPWIIRGLNMCLTFKEKIRCVN
jgi:hypothetical protein